MMELAAGQSVALVHAVTLLEVEQVALLHLFSCCAHTAAPFCA